MTRTENCVLFSFLVYVVLGNIVIAKKFDFRELEKPIFIIMSIKISI